VETYLAESFEPRRDDRDLADVDAQVRAAAEAAGIRYVRSIFVPEDETCFHEFEAPSADVVRDALARTQLSVQRVVSAFERATEEGVERQ
jgi:hypothetical protein